MPRYFFHVRDHLDFDDLQGTVLPDIGAARQEAVRFAGALLKDHAERFWDNGEWHMCVADDTGLTLFQLTFFSTNSPATSPTRRA